ncbi:MAG: DUF5979 domain-containing protein [Tissierellaceae bacterium]|nr:DUF5979 domain-containing protein [Tissierellaceae bacterium]
MKIVFRNGIAIFLVFVMIFTLGVSTFTEDINGEPLDILNDKGNSVAGYVYESEAPADSDVEVGMPDTSDNQDQPKVPDVSGGEGDTVTGDAYEEDVEKLEYTIIYYFTALDGEEIVGEMKGEVDSDNPEINAEDIPDPEGLPERYVIDEEISTLPFEVTEENNVIKVYYVPNISIQLQLGEATPDNPLIRVSKTFFGLTQEQINQLTNFKITITSQSDSRTAKDLSLNDVDVIGPIIDNGEITYKWAIEDWPAGTYNVVETGEALTNYTVDTDNDGEVTTVAAEVEWDTRLWRKTNTQKYNDLKIDGIAPNLIATKLTESAGVFVWTEHRLSASQTLAIIAALKTINPLSIDNGTEFYWFSGDDPNDLKFTFRGQDFDYNFENGILHIPDSSQWSQIVSGAYSFIGGYPADIAVKNTYTLQTVDVTIEKEVTGNFGDLTREFAFTVIVDGDDPIKFSLSDGESEELEDIPINAVLTLTEVSNGYDVAVKVGEDEITQNDDGSYTIDLSVYKSDITISVTNHKYVDIGTGITFDTLPYILILGLTTVGLGVGIVRKKNIRKED